MSFGKLVVVLFHHCRDQRGTRRNQPHGISAELLVIGNAAAVGSETRKEAGRFDSPASPMVLAGEGDRGEAVGGGDIHILGLSSGSTLDKKLVAHRQTGRKGRQCDRVRSAHERTT